MISVLNSCVSVSSMQMQINSKPTHMHTIIVVLQINTYFSHHLSKLLITTIKNSSFPKRCTTTGSNTLVHIFLQMCLKVPCSLAAPWVVVALGLSMDSDTPCLFQPLLLCSGQGDSPEGWAVADGGSPSRGPPMGDAQGNASTQCCQSHSSWSAMVFLALLSCQVKCHLQQLHKRYQWKFLSQPDRDISDE